jgi:hypothetical protein
MLYTGFNLVAKPFHTKGVRLRPLQKPAISANDIVQSVLRGFIEFWSGLATNLAVDGVEMTFRCENDWIVRSRDIS